ncbi:hypothetical protein ACFSKW_34475 [Nonomuraea mangrovi]|uniref:Uncharacterized protein n=1 Tax=Nonomuraea mangrovi TaxID=2316207 RepID=A0ABW4T4I7_9ACTN
MGAKAADVGPPTGHEGGQAAEAEPPTGWESEIGDLARSLTRGVVRDR